MPFAAGTDAAWILSSRNCRTSLLLSSSSTTFRLSLIVKSSRVTALTGGCELESSLLVLPLLASCSSRCFRLRASTSERTCSTHCRKNASSSEGSPNCLSETARIFAARRCSVSSCCFRRFTQFWYRSSSSLERPLWFGASSSIIVVSLAGGSASCDGGKAGGRLRSAVGDLAASADTSAEYAEVCAFSTAPRSVLLVLLACLIWFSRNERSSSRASALPFHLSSSFLYFLQSSSRCSASFMNQSRRFSSDWIFKSRRVFVSSSSAFCFSSFSSFCTVYMKLL
mmetsp:Transcript_142634/g.397460  ORF Transcript_142634/g.397460 Transcript_142634/m.397460 type:complete len:283 (+) Transcript_142634:135-983(+)